MALKALIFKAELQISDMDRGYYATHLLTIAQHPSETDERTMVRLLAFACHANDSLAFGKGIAADDEPELWDKDLTGAIDLWIEAGLPDEKRIRKACGRSRRVVIYTYGGRTASLWWDQNASKLRKLDNVSVIDIPDSSALTAMTNRNMQIQCTIQDGEIWLSDGQGSQQITIETRQQSKKQAR